MAIVRAAHLASCSLASSTALVACPYLCWGQHPRAPVRAHGGHAYLCAAMAERSSRRTRSPLPWLAEGEADHHLRDNSPSPAAAHEPDVSSSFARLPGSSTAACSRALASHGVAAFSSGAGTAARTRKPESGRCGSGVADEQLLLGLLCSLLSLSLSLLIRARAKRRRSELRPANC